MAGCFVHNPAPDDCGRCGPGMVCSADAQCHLACGSDADCDGCGACEGGTCAMPECGKSGAVCGDGLVRGTEGCDDGNRTKDDGCDHCKVEGGYGCGGEPSTCTRVTYVNGAHTQDGDGLTWATARNDLRAVLLAATGETEIWIARGTYLPSGESDNSVSFILKDGMALYGGFDGAADTPKERRSVAADETILSGDLFGDDETGGSIAENSARVVDTAATGNFVLDGLTVAGGAAYLVSPVPIQNGAGIALQGGHLTLRNVVIRDNSAYQGSSALYGNGLVDASHVTFTRNGGGEDGGAAVYINVGARLDHCTISHNSVRGGTFYSTAPDSVVITNSIIADNSGAGTLIFTGNGPGAHVVIANSIVSGNAENSLFIGSGYYNFTIDLLGTLIVDNASYDGSLPSTFAFHQVSGDATLVFNVVNSTIAGNIGASLFERSAFSAGLAVLSFTNSIVFGNNTGGSAVFTPAVGQNDPNMPLYASYSCLQEPLAGNGNIYIDPGFAPDYSLLATSPAVDAGNNSALSFADLYDIDGDGDFTEPWPNDLATNPRFRDSPVSSDTGTGTAPIVDLGALEFQP